MAQEIAEPQNAAQPESLINYLARAAKLPAVILIVPSCGLYILFYIALSYADAGRALSIYNIAIDMIVGIATIITAIAFVPIIRPEYRIYFYIIAAAAFCMIVTDFTWALIIDEIGDLSTIPFADLLFRLPFLFWTILMATFWLLLLLNTGNVSEHRDHRLVFTAFLGAAAILLFLYHYIPLLDIKTKTYVHAFVLVYASIELAAFVLCIASAVGRAYRFPRILALGFVVLVTTDFLYNSSELLGRMEPNYWAGSIWTLAEIIMFIGVLKTYDMIAHIDNSFISEARRATEFSHGIASILAFAAAMALLAALVITFFESQQLRVSASIFTIGVVAIVSNKLSLLHGLAVSNAIFNSNDKDDSITGSEKSLILRLFGSFNLVHRIKGNLLEIQERTIEVGEEFLFSREPTRRAPKPKTVFLAMPYGEPWSDIVFEKISRIQGQCGWTINRADQQFSSHDLLQNMWNEICAAEIFVADISGCNPNVMYEIGIAHSLGKPVILLMQKNAVVPFDLSVQRTVFYQLTEDDNETPLTDRLVELLESYDNKNQ